MPMSLFSNAVVTDLSVVVIESVFRMIVQLALSLVSSIY